MRFTLAIIAMPLFLAGSALARDAAAPLDEQVRAAHAEQAAADAEVAKLEKLAAKAESEADRLRAGQAAAAQGIEAAEARITAADAQARLAAAHVAAYRRALVEQQRPASLLLAGLAVMARRPPLLALADGGGTDELVKVRILLDSTLPAIRTRSARLSAQLEQGEQLQQKLADARVEMERSRQDLVLRRQQFAGLEQKAVEQSLRAGGRALAAGDVSLVSGEQAARLQDAQSAKRSAAALASALATLDPAPPRPTVGEGAVTKPPFVYALPANAPVTEGLGNVNASGVRSRGLTLATARGAIVIAPADGTVRFSGPFRDYDGVLIIDHGGGWISLLVNVSSNLQPGETVRLGDEVGRALGPLLVELSQNGRRISPALIAGSSATLSKIGKGG